MASSHPVMVHTPTSGIQHLSCVEWELLLQLLHNYNNEVLEDQAPQGFYSLLMKLEKVDHEVQKERS